jgi:hypothetical protein
MRRSELNAMKNRIRQDRKKVSDLDVIVEEILKLPHGQLKKVLTEEVLAVLRKYGYTE